ncbi:hypothetical protein OS493_024386 [Desmophyllum pertusum]|uniref:RING-type domain-containing protein n=1 Tax=Desmophyllum pertusum TaxID=174260 RepID=A0A9W9YN67_9CNID|nr:hypothetical protein OS493_024386 [Desmophyllum pertusum]
MSSEFFSTSPSLPSLQRELFKCPNCRAMLLPLNGDEEPPAEIPEGYHVLKFERVRYERESGSSQAAITNFIKLEMSTMEKVVKRRKRSAKRFAAFLATSCIICHTPRENRCPLLPCCSILIHEGCLLNSFHQGPHCLHCRGELFKCPNCRALLFPVIGDEEPPAEIPEGYRVFNFEHARYELEGGSAGHKRKRADFQTIPKCTVCNTRSETPCRRLPCCRRMVHEGCVLNSFHQVPAHSQELKCPKCYAMLLPLNGDEEPPAVIPKGYHVLKFEHVKYEREGESSQAATSAPNDLPTCPPTIVTHE